MRYIEIKASSVDAAIEEGLKELGATRDLVDVEILAKGGIFKKASVKLTLKDTLADKSPVVAPIINETIALSEPFQASQLAARDTDELPKPSFYKEEDISKLTGIDKECVDFVSELLVKMQLNCYLKVVSTLDKLAILICGEDTNFALGFRGEALDNMQYLTLLVANRNARFKKKLIIDAEGYREKRAETLTELSRKLAYKVAKTRRAVELEPMNPFERRVIHTSLQNDKYVTTSSEGVEPFRFVVISPKDNAYNNTDRTSTYTDRNSSVSAIPNNTDSVSECIREDRDTKVDATTAHNQDAVVDSTMSNSDMYDQNSKSNFRKAGMGKTRSFGNKQRKF